MFDLKKDYGHSRVATMANLVDLAKGSSAATGSTECSAAPLVEASVSRKCPEALLVSEDLTRNWGTPTCSGLI